MSAEGRTPAVAPPTAGKAPPRVPLSQTSSAVCLTEHRVEFRVGSDRPYFLSAAAGDCDLAGPFKRLLA